MENGSPLKLLMPNMLVVKPFYRFLFEDSTGMSDPHLKKFSFLHAHTGVHIRR